MNKKIVESRLSLRNGYHLQRLYPWQFKPGDRVYDVNSVYPTEVIDVWTDYETMTCGVMFAGGKGISSKIDHPLSSDFVVDRNEGVSA